MHQDRIENPAAWFRRCLEEEYWEAEQPPPPQKKEPVRPGVVSLGSMSEAFADDYEEND